MSLFEKIKDDRIEAPLHLQWRGDGVRTNSAG